MDGLGAADDRGTMDCVGSSLDSHSSPWALPDAPQSLKLHDIHHPAVPPWETVSVPCSSADGTLDPCISPVWSCGAALCTGSLYNHGICCTARYKVMCMA